MRRILPALAVLLACAACTPPIYDPVASLAGETIAKTQWRGATTVLDTPDLDEDGNPDFDREEDTFTFLPERGPGWLDFSRGFVLRSSDYDQGDIWYTWPEGETTRWMRTWWSFDAYSTMPSRWPVWLKTGPHVGALSLDGDGEARSFWADTATSQLNDMGSITLAPDLQADLGLGSLPHLTGISLAAHTDFGQDLLGAIVRINDQYSEGWTTVSSGGIGAWASVMGTNYPLPFLGTPWRLVYFRDFPKARSFAQWYDGTTWRTWSWWGTGPTENAELTHVTHRIDAVLSPAAGPSASYLFSTEGDMGRVYKYEGAGFVDELVAEFPLGAMRFVGEMLFGDGVWRLVFSRTIRWGDGIQFEIRTIDTDDLVSTFAN